MTTNSTAKSTLAPTAAELVHDLTHSFLTHDTLPKDESKAFRKWGGGIPYGVHPTWCAMTVLAEPLLPMELRRTLTRALAFHDLKEDTDGRLPRNISAEEASLIDELTFLPGTAKDAIFDRSELAQLGKLYDCANNLLGLRPANEGAKLAGHIVRTLELARRAEERYGPLDIITIARALCAAKTRKENA